MIENGDAVAHAERFFLIMGHKDEGDAQPPLQIFQLHLHLLAQFQIERTQRLVKQQHPRLVNQRPGQRNALALTAGELRGFAPFKTGQAHKFEHLLDPQLPLAFGYLANHQPIGNVFAYAHVREEGVILKDGVNIPLEGGEVRHTGAVQIDFAVRRAIKAGDHAQAGRFARARGAEHGEKLAILDLEIDAVHGFDLAKGAGDFFEDNCRDIVCFVRCRH